MQTVTFEVQGSSEVPYQVVFAADDESVICTCSCKAGKTGQLCKHRNRILAGSAEDIVGDFANDFTKVQSWLPGSSLALAFAAVGAAEEKVEAAKRDVAAAKKDLIIAMRT